MAGFLARRFSSAKVSVAAGSRPCGRRPPRAPLPPASSRARRRLRTFTRRLPAARFDLRSPPRCARARRAAVLNRRDPRVKVTPSVLGRPAGKTEWAVSIPRPLADHHAPGIKGSHPRREGRRAHRDHRIRRRPSIEGRLRVRYGAEAAHTGTAARTTARAGRAGKQPPGKAGAGGRDHQAMHVTSRLAFGSRG